MGIIRTYSGDQCRNWCASCASFVNRTLVSIPNADGRRTYIRVNVKHTWQYLVNTAGCPQEYMLIAISMVGTWMSLTSNRMEISNWRYKRCSLRLSSCIAQSASMACVPCSTYPISKLLISASGCVLRGRWQGSLPVAWLSRIDALLHDPPLPLQPDIL